MIMVIIIIIIIINTYLFSPLTGLFRDNEIKNLNGKYATDINI